MFKKIGCGLLFVLLFYTSALAAFKYNPFTQKLDYYETGGATSPAPASTSDTGTAGQIAYDSQYLYVAVGTNTWKRVLLSAWSAPVLLQIEGVQIQIAGVDLKSTN